MSSRLLLWYPKVIPAFPSWEEWRDHLRGPLTTRGWAFQELQLSPRIVHYRKNRVSWECSTCVTIDADASVHRETWEIHGCRLLDGHIEDLPTWDSSPTWLHGTDHLFSRWMRVTELYSTKRLTFKEDKLPALSGLAAAFHSVASPGDYYAGLWGEDLAHGLCWKRAIPLQGIRLTIGDIPSRSWASMDGPVVDEFPDKEKRCNIYTDFSVNLAASGTDVHGMDLYEKVKGGRLVARGQLREFYYTLRRETFEFKIDYDVAGSSDNITSEKKTRKTVLLMSILQTKQENQRDVDLGIALMPVSSARMYRRVGFFQLGLCKEDRRRVREIVII